MITRDKDPLPHSHLVQFSGKIGAGSAASPTTEHQHFIAYYRQRAEELRALANIMKSPSAKKKMRALAEQYEGMAKRAEERLARVQKSLAD